MQIQRHNYLLPGIFLLLNLFLTPTVMLHGQSNWPKIDSSFNGIGYNLVEDCIFFEPDYLTLQPDGKILAAGYGNVNDVFGDQNGIVARLNPDGTLDSGFGTNGIKSIDVDGGPDRLGGITVLPDQKILVLLESAFRSIFTRLNPDGSFDTSFGNDGFLYVPTEDYEAANVVLIQSDHKILIVSDILDNNNKYIVSVRRCNANGELDETYGNNGRLILSNLTQSFHTPKAILQNDDKLLITGFYGQLSNSGFIAVRVNTDGTLDHSFSGDGVYFKTMGDASYPGFSESLAVKPDGTIYISGSAPNTTNVPLTVLSLTSTGSINTSFGFGGIARIPLDLYATGRSMVVQPDGKFLLGGYEFPNPNNTKFILARMNADGSPDLTFGTKGIIGFSPFGANYAVQIFNEIELAPNGAVIGLGWVRETLNLTANCVTLLSVHRYLTGITVKAEEPSPLFQETKAIPNIVSDQEPILLEYTLSTSGKIQIGLYDESGRLIRTLLSSTVQNAGNQSERCVLPSGLPAGNYYLVLDNGMQVKPVKVLKM